MAELSKSQQKILDFIRNSIQEGISPSVREICAATDLKSTATVHSHLKALEEKGLIVRNQGSNRSIRLTNDNTAFVPVLGKVTAGIPILAIEDVECYIPISENVRRGRELFALRVVGESMINAGILDGDIDSKKKSRLSYKIIKFTYNNVTEAKKIINSDMPNKEQAYEEMMTGKYFSRLKLHLEAEKKRNG